MNFGSGCRVASAALLAVVLAGCGTSDSSSGVTQADIIQSCAIERLKDETFYFPSIDPDTRETHVQPLRRFDLIFVGHDLDKNASEAVEIARMIPGTYTHMLAYIGKDSDGFAYAAEMNVDENLSYSVGSLGLRIGGGTYVYCLGGDYGIEPCPVDDHFFGLETYDYMVAKRFESGLRDTLMSHEAHLLATIKEDALSGFAFQAPFNASLETVHSQVVRLVDDGRVNGADCTSYFTSLFEEIAGVCPDDVRIGAAELSDYYNSDPVGRLAKIPAKFNIVGEGDVYMHELLDEGYVILDTAARATECEDGRVVQGVPTPDRFFNSPSLVAIEPTQSSAFLPDQTR